MNMTAETTQISSEFRVFLSLCRYANESIEQSRIFGRSDITSRRYCEVINEIKRCKKEFLGVGEQYTLLAENLLDFTRQDFNTLLEAQR